MWCFSCCFSQPSLTQEIEETTREEESRSLLVDTDGDESLVRPRSSRFKTTRRDLKVTVQKDSNTSQVDNRTLVTNDHIKNQAKSQSRSQHYRGESADATSLVVEDNTDKLIQNQMEDLSARLSKLAPQLKREEEADEEKEAEESRLYSDQQAQIPKSVDSVIQQLNLDLPTPTPASSSLISVWSGGMSISTEISKKIGIEGSRKSLSEASVDIETVSIGSLSPMSVASITLSSPNSLSTSSTSLNDLSHLDSAHNSAPLSTTTTSPPHEENGQHE